MYFKRPTQPVILFFLLLQLCKVSYGQSGLCDATTPFFSCDLSGQPNGVWTSPPSTRIDNCCSTTKPDRCIEFKITLDSSAVAINFDIASGAVPPGALYYQIACGPLTSVGTPICLNGPGPYTLTFCKPGNNINTYAITSIGAPTVSPDKTIGDGCSTTIYASGLLVNSSITWTSISPGAPGTYNSYLSCTSSCDSTVVTAKPGYPPYVDFMVCGTPAGGKCVSSGQYCDTVRVYFSPPIINTVTPNPAVFCANTNGILLTGTPNGGVPPYTFAWTNGPNGTGTVVGSDTTYTATVAGTYSFIVYDVNYPICPPKITNVPVTVSPIPVIDAGPNQDICGTTAVLNGTVTGATGGIWTGGNGTFSPSNTSPNATYTPTPSELASGILVLTFTSTGNGACAAVADQVIIRISPPVTVSLTAPAIVCFGQTAVITANVTGGTPPFTFLWSTGQTTSTLTNMGPGTYTVTVTGATGCIGTAVATIAGNPQIIVTTSPNNTISCNTTTPISATATGGTGSLTYYWSNGATSPSTNVNTGTYIVTVTDAAGCTASNSVSVVAANSTLIAVVNQPSVLCNGATTTLTVLASGGFGNYSYLWNNGSTTNSVVVGAGSYCATVTDGGGCITNACVNVTQNPVLNVSIPTPSIVCNGSSATIYATVNGGQPPYTYLWSNGQNTQFITQPAGNHTVTVSDAIGCNKSATVTITQAAVITPTASATPVSCFGGNNGSVTANVTGGVQPYYFSWSPYGGGFATASGLMSGTYTVTITDGIGCTALLPVIVTQPDPLTATITSSANVSCYGGSDGTATVSPAGGTAPYLYNWSPTGGTGPAGTNLQAGTYTIYITDAKGCNQSIQTTITQPSLLTASIGSTTNVSCNGGNNGSATVSGSGGTPGYTYVWAPGGIVGATASNLLAGTYSVTITDAKGCTALLTATITQPPVLTAVISGSTNVSCNGGSNGTATVTPSGGTGPYTFLWNTSPAQTTPTAINLSAGNYAATVTDAKGCIVTTSGISITQPSPLNVTVSPSALISCNSTITITSSASGGTGSYSSQWSNGATSSSITVNTGTYVITVTDGNGCTATNSVSVQAANSTLAATINQPAAICNGSATTVSVNATGGFGSYTYLWNTGATGSSIVAGAGNYCVTVTDANACIANACVTITQNLPLTVAITTPPDICPGADATITANTTGGQLPYTYFWNTGQTAQSVIKPVGTYSVTVMDATGGNCTATATVTITQETPMSTTVSKSNVGCYGGSNGAAIVYVSGGMPGYTYSWSPFGGSNSSAANLIPGTYIVTITDAIGCITTASATITQPASAVAGTISSTHVSCFGQSDGTATVSASGGTAPYTYYWSPSGNFTPSISGLPAGTYTATVADTTGCFTSSSVIITEPPAIIITETTVNAICNNNNGSASITANGGTGAYTYAWTPSGGSAATAGNLYPGNYTVTVTDAKGCQKQLPLIIGSTPSDITAKFSSTAACLNTVTSFYDSSIVSGDIITSWLWNFGEPSSGSNNTSTFQNPAHTYSSAGIYAVTLTVTSQKNCTHSVTITITVNPLPVAGFTVAPSCVNGITTFTNTSSISTGSITSVSWDFGDPTSGANNTSNLQNPTHTFLTQGTHLVTLTVTSDKGCSRMTTQNITISSVPVVSFNATTVCKGSTTQFTDASTINGATITNWSWDFGDGSSFNTSQNPSYLYTSSGTYNVILTVTSSGGCQSKDTVAVTVNPSPVPNFSGTNVCLNNVTSFTDLSTVSVGTISSSTWNFGDFTSNSNNQNPTHLYKAAGTFNVTLTVVSSNGCSSTVTKPVEVYALPTANFYAYLVTCVGNATVFTDNSSVPGGSISSWLWAFGDGSPVNNSQNPSHTYALAGTYNPSLIVTSNNGCMDTISNLINVYPRPVVNFSVDDSSGCENYCTQFTDLSNPLKGTITKWQWGFGDTSALGGTQNPIHCYAMSGFYSISLTVTSSYGCVGTTTKTNLIQVFPVPTAEFSYTPQPPTTLNSTVYFTDQSVNANTWLWDFGDGSTPGSTIKSPDHYYSGDQGTYCITLMVGNSFNCKDTVVHCLNIQPEFTFFIPNAFTPRGSKGINDTFSGKGTFISKYDMWIFDRWGNMIFHTDDLNVGWDGRVQPGGPDMSGNSQEIAQQDVYVYLVELYDLQENKHKYMGTVTLVR